MSNIIQEFLLKKQKFNFHESPPHFYWKDFKITPELNARTVLIFKEYEVVIAKYLVYNQNYYVFEIASEIKKSCKTILEVFEFVKQNADINLTAELVTYSFNKITNKINDLMLKSNSLVAEVTGLQRSLAVFESKSNDSKMLKSKINETQKKINKYQKELSVLKEIKKLLPNYPIL